MYNRYQGNTGRVVRVDDRGAPVGPPGRAPERTAAPGPGQKQGPGHNPAPGQRGAQGRPSHPPQTRPAAQGPGRGPTPGLMEQLSHLGQLIPNNLSQLETEDIILLLILYLMYRESGDSELLMIMGGMFLL